MKFITTNSYERLSELAAEYIAAQVILKPESVLGLATRRHLQMPYREIQKGQS